MKRALVSCVLMTVVALAGCKKKKEDAPASGSAAGTGAAPSGTGAAAGTAAAAPDKPADPPKTATPPTGDMAGMSIDAACDKMIAMMTSMATVVDTNKGKCDAMGEGLEKWAAENKAFMAWAKEQDKDAAKKKEVEEKCKPKMGPVMEKIGPMMGGIGECAENAKVKAAMASME